jgi:2'-5' RNA ligase
MRAFIAIELPEAVRRQLGDLSVRLRQTGSKASWVQPDRMHLTLRFLGEVSEEQIAVITASMTDVCRDIAPFTLVCEGLGGFPNLRKPSVIWVGVSPFAPDLARIQTAAETGARACGLSPETKRFHPHVTLARIRNPEDVSALTQQAEAESAFCTGAFDVFHVSLFSSELTPRGPVYTRIHDFPLKRVET